MSNLIKTKDFIAAVVLLAFSIVMYSATFNLGRLTVSQIGAEFAPRLVAIGIFILSIILLIQTIKDWRIALKKDEQAVSEEGKLAEEEAQEDIAEDITESPVSNAERYKNLGMTVGLIALYFWLMPIIGFLISTAVYLFVQFGLLAQRKYWNIPLFIILSIVVSTSIYYTFRLGFEVMLPRGILG
ncbi:tripartite tricarboxylate transporter TctB family protein [Bacillus sp. FJAT-44742]|uniref:tripartite tricarboxylate transporter TctB family protein n=1 Tax=Bacillus sp. FJAT-44742 TaxID=2014005 RepID=UPI000C23358F|nr:tripartite tricarboxylate transporter TctB family protein [Bacillus sp. FJAT-44742]